MSKKLKAVLADNIDDGLIGKLVRGYDVIGDLCIIIIPEELVAKEELIGQAIMENVPGVRLVAKREGVYSGEYRTIGLKIIAGHGGFETLHREFGLRLHVNPDKVYFSPRSGQERFRLAQLVEEGEEVLVMFSGVAPLPLMIGLHGLAAHVDGIEKNPHAHKLGLKNLKANRKIKNVSLIEGDVSNSGHLHGRMYDRICMPLPTNALNYLGVALRHLKSTGSLHYYLFSKEHEFQNAVDQFVLDCDRCGREVVRATIGKCGHIGPGKYRVCIDALLR